MEFERNADTEALNNYSLLKKQLEIALKEVEQTSDLREAKGLLIEVQSSFKGLKLLKENREELYNKLQDAFAVINSKIEDERANFNHEALQNYTVLKTRVDEALFLANNPKDFKETWDYLIEVQAQFKGAKLQREHRESLYSRLQEAFEKVKKIRDHEKINLEKESAENYIQLNINIEKAIEYAKEADDFRKAKDALINAQNEFRNTKLMKEQRDELYAKLQNAFILLNNQLDEAADKSRLEAEKQFKLFDIRTLDILKRANETAEFTQIRTEIKQIQAEIRDTFLLKEQKDALYIMIQEAFETVNLRQDHERISFEQDAQNNYKRLKTMINDGLLQAEESNEYKETREYLKKIQNEFKGIKLIREQREELYSRLQSAFEILNKRVDEYFHEKKKNWEVKMQYKLTSLSTDIFNVEKSLEKDFERQQELEDHLQIVESSGKETSATLGLKARISSLQINIEKKQNLIKILEKEMTDLKTRLDPEE